MGLAREIYGSGKLSEGCCVLVGSCFMYRWAMEESLVTREGAEICDTPWHCFPHSTKLGIPRASAAEDFSPQCVLHPSLGAE